MILISLFLVSCNDEATTSMEDKCKIVCSVDSFESPNPSRTNTDPNNDFLITWASGDAIGIFPREGYQEPFEIPASQIGKENASFDGGYWDVKNGLQYNAYYPFDKRNFDSAEMKTRIPVTYIGQKQNGTSCDIGAFDYTHSDWNTASEGTVNFQFHHIGAIAVFSLKYPATTTYTRMTLSVNEALIPLNGHYDLTAEDVKMINDEESLSTSISLELENCNGAAGETGVFYMMLPPMDLSNDDVTLTLTSEAGTTCTYSIEEALNVNKGKLYRRTGVPTEINVEGTIDGWKESYHPDAVDLGLSVMWAKCNIGATQPEEYGDFYAWGEQETKDSYTWENYSYYNTNNGAWVDLGESISGTSFDVAHNKLGEGWRMPTKDEMGELLDNCQATHTTINGVSGILFTASNGNSIFLPKAGFWTEGMFTDENVSMRYWTATQYVDAEYSAWVMGYDGVNHGTSFFNNILIGAGYAACRPDGCNIRPVYEK